MKKKPTTLCLLPAMKGGPTPEHILQMFERVTGRRRTAEGVTAVNEEFEKAGIPFCGGRVVHHRET